MISQEDEEKLLGLLKDIESIEHQYKDELFRGFNLFAIAGLVRQEVRHSKILAFLFNPNESHGLGDSLVKKVIIHGVRASSHKERPNSLDMALADFDDLLVSPEAGYNNKRIDILAWSPRNKLIMILENKVDSDEGANQLQDYRDQILKDANYEDYKKIFLYLTIDGDAPSDTEWWVPIGYQLILDTLTELINLKKSSLSEQSVIFISHYIDLVKRYIMENINPELKNACITLYEKHKNILDIVFSNLPTPISDAGRLFLEENKGSITKFDSNKRQLIFLTNKLMTVIPETDGTNWAGQKRPVIISFAFADNKIGIFIEVGPMADEGVRTKLVQELQHAINGKTREGSGTTFSKVYSHYKKFDSNEMNSKEVLNTMKLLFEKINKEEILDKTYKVCISTEWSS